MHKLAYVTCTGSPRLHTRIRAGALHSTALQRPVQVLAAAW